MNIESLVLWFFVGSGVAFWLGKVWDVAAAAWRGREL